MQDKKKKDRIVRWVRLHPKVSMIYMNPLDIPDGWLPDTPEMCIESCYVLLSDEVPPKQFWPVPGRHGHQMALYLHQLQKVRDIRDVLEIMTKEVQVRLQKIT